MYLLAVQTKNGTHDLVDIEDYEKGIPKGAFKHPELERIDSSYVPVYFWSFADGQEDVKLTEYGAKLYCRINSTKITKTSRMTKTSFGAEYHGFHPGLGCETRGKAHTKQLMRERGLIEVGDSKPKAHGRVAPNTITEDTIKECVERGGDISGNEAKALIDGSYSSEG